MPIRNKNSTTYVHPDEPNLVDLHKAMRYNAAGEPEIRTSAIVEGDIVISGDVNIPGTINVASSPENPVHVHVTESVPIDLSTTTLAALEHISIDNFPAFPTSITANQGTAGTSAWPVDIGSNGTVKLGAGSQIIGKVGQDTTVPWTIGLNTGSNTIGKVDLNTGSNTIGKVLQDKSTPWTVGLDTGSNTIGKVDQASTSNPWVISRNTNANDTNNPIYVNLTNTEVEIKNELNNPISISANNQTNTANNPIYTSGTTTISTPVTIGGFPDSAISAFDELLSITVTPLIQADVVYGLDTDIFETAQIGGASVSVDSSTKMWQVQSGTGTTAFARLRTKRFVRYQPGQGLLFRFTAQFTSTGTGSDAVGVNYVAQGAGALNREDSYYFGFNGQPGTPKFGIAHTYNGKVENRTLTINTAPTGAQTAVVTINGTVYNVPIVAGTTLYTAATIGAYLKANITDGSWQVEACDNKVIVSYHRAGPQNNSFAFSSSGTGTPAAGSWVRTTTGVAGTTEWVYINAWDNPPASTFNPAKLNVYAMDMRWLGAGIVRFFIEDPDTGKMKLVHTQHWANKNNQPHISNPSLRLGYACLAAGGTPAQNATVSGASIMGAIEGIINQTGYSQGYYNLDSTTRNKDVVYHLLSIQNPLTRSGVVNTSQLIIQDLTVAAQGNDPCVIYIVVNAVGTSDKLIFQTIPGAAGVSNFAQYSNSAVTENLALDRLANVQTLGINSSAQFDLKPYNFSLPAGDYISVFISSSNAINRTSVALTWKVD